MSNESNRTGIYFLIKNCEVVYVGKTTVWPSRLWYHKSQAMDYDSVKFIECKKGDLHDYEIRWIKRFSPIHNHAHNKKMAVPEIKQHQRGSVFKHMKFRKLTLKSFLDYGGYRDRTVQDMIDHKKYLDLISAYFKLSHITFFDDVLEILKITPEWRIDKPGTDKEKYLQFILSIWPDEAEHRRQVGEKIHHKKSKFYLKESARHNESKIYHRRFNQKP